MYRVEFHAVKCAEMNAGRIRTEGMNSRFGMECRIEFRLASTELVGIGALGLMDGR